MFFIFQIAEQMHTSVEWVMNNVCSLELRGWGFYHKEKSLLNKRKQ